MGLFQKNKTNRLIANIEKYFDSIDQMLLIFKDGVRNYLYSKREAFDENLQNMVKFEAELSVLRREIQNDLFTRTALTRSKGDIMRLFEKMGHIVKLLSDNLMQFEIEIPLIPSELNELFIKLTEFSTLAVESSLPAAKAYFKTPEIIPEKINRVYYYEKETAKCAQALKRKVFHEMMTIKLSEKFHLRYLALHIENLSEAAESVADQLSLMHIKRSL